MKYLKAPLLVALSSLALVACNGGGGSSGGDTPAPSPSPTPTPVAVQPLEITQNIIPSLNKIGSHQIWYMIVKNPNAFPVSISSSNLENGAFRYDNANKTPLNPTQYTMAYDNGVSGINLDCLNVINLPFPEYGELLSGQSCAYKFDAQWKGNTTGQTNFNFKMAYTFSSPDVLDPTWGYRYTYIESSNCIEKRQDNDYCLANNQNLQFNLMNLSTINNEFKYPYQTAMSGNYGGSIISIDGSTLWDTESGLDTVNVYSINYSSLANTTHKVLLNTYYGTQFNSQGYAGFAAISTNGQNFYQSKYNQNGVMPSVQSTVTDLAWIYGLDGNIYGSSSYTVYPQMIYKLNQVNNSLSEVIAAPHQILRGVSPTGSLLVDSTDGSKVTSCYAANSYSQTTMNLNGLTKQMGGSLASATPNGYTYPVDNNVSYVDLLGRGRGMAYNLQLSINAYVDIESCALSNSKYTSAYYTLNSQFGIVGYNGNNYIESVNQFTNGLNGGN